MNLKKLATYITSILFIHSLMAETITIQIILEANGQPCHQFSLSLDNQCSIGTVISEVEKYGYRAKNISFGMRHISNPSVTLADLEMRDNDEIIFREAEMKMHILYTLGEFPRPNDRPLTPEEVAWYEDKRTVWLPLDLTQHDIVWNKRTFFSGDAVYHLTSEGLLQKIPDEADAIRIHSILKPGETLYVEKIGFAIPITLRFYGSPLHQDIAFHQTLYVGGNSLKEIMQMPFYWAVTLNELNNYHFTYNGRDIPAGTTLRDIGFSPWMEYSTIEGTYRDE